MDLTPQVSHTAEWQLAAAVSSAVVITIIWPTHWKRKLYNYVICKSRQPRNSWSYTKFFVSGRYLIIEARFVLGLIKHQLMKFSWVDLVLFFVCPVLPASRVVSFIWLYLHAIISGINGFIHASQSRAHSSAARLPIMFIHAGWETPSAANIQFLIVLFFCKINTHVYAFNFLPLHRHRCLEKPVLLCSLSVCLASRTIGYRHNFPFSYYAIVQLDLCRAGPQMATSCYIGESCWPVFHVLLRCPVFTLQGPLLSHGKRFLSHSEYSHHEVTTFLFEAMIMTWAG